VKIRQKLHKLYEVHFLIFHNIEELDNLCHRILEVELVEVELVEVELVEVELVEVELV
jgi:hypothetical protein